MDPLDHVRADLDGSHCAVCDGPVPGGATRILAHRDGVAVLQVACPGCGSESLDFRVDGATPTASPGPSRAQRRPVTVDDVLDMHVFLASWRGSLAELL